MPGGAMHWQQDGKRAWVMELADGGGDWIEVKSTDESAGPTWRVDARLNGNHYRMSDAFPTMQAAQGCALLLAMRQVPASRESLHAQLDVVPGAWWWKIVPVDDGSAEHRSIFSSRITDSLEAAERSGRAAGGGWWLYVYGPGCVRAFGLLPR
jgi:hypothetical protein